MDLLRKRGLAEATIAVEMAFIPADALDLLRHPGRLGEVTDLQGGIVYLASSVSDYMTGHNLIIEGGQTLW